MEKELNPSKCLWKTSKRPYCILSVNTNTNQRYFQLQKLTTDKKRLRYGSNIFDIFTYIPTFEQALKQI